MSDQNGITASRVSRRHFLSIASVGGGAVMALGLAQSTAAEPKKKFVLAYNLKRAIAVLGTEQLIGAMQA